MTNSLLFQKLKGSKSSMDKLGRNVSTKQASEVLEGNSEWDLGIQKQKAVECQGKSAFQSDKHWCIKASCSLNRSHWQRDQTKEHTNKEKKQHRLDIKSLATESNTATALQTSRKAGMEQVKETTKQKSGWVDMEGGTDAAGHWNCQTTRHNGQQRHT